ncbi:MAG: EAL domain-containing protein [Methylococcus sp.]|nr:EAL domain-containing protein [Methylococcus sp.]
MLEFGRDGGIRLGGQNKPGAWCYGVLLLGVAIASFASPAWLNPSIHYFLGCPAGAWAAWTLHTAAGRDRSINRWLDLAAAVMAVFGIIIGFAVSPAPFFPASVFNEASFRASTGFPVSLAEGFCAIAFLAAMALHGCRLAALSCDPEPRASWAPHGWKPALTALVLLAGGWGVAGVSQRFAESEIRDELRGRALALATLITPERLHGLSSANSAGNGESLPGQLAALLQADPRLQRLSLILPGPVSVAKLDLPPGGNRLVAARNVENSGYEFAAFAPIHDLRSGRLLGLLGLHGDAEASKRHIAEHRLTAMGATLLAVLLMLGVAASRQRLWDAALSISRSERRYRIVADFNYDWEYWQVPDGALRYVSPSCERITGYSADALLNEPALLERMIHPEDRYPLHGRPCPSAGPAAEVEADFRIVRADGEIRWIGHVSRPIYGEHGEFLGLRVSNRDITLRKRAEEAWRRGELHLREAQRLANLGSWELDLLSGRLEWSEQVFRIFEIDPQQFGTSYAAFIALVHPEDREAVNHAYTQSVADRLPYSIVHRLLMPDGRVKHVCERGETYYGEDGQPLRSMGTVQDISEQRRLENDSRQLASIVESSDDAIIGANLDGIVLNWNRAAERIYGYAAAEIVGQPLFCLCPPERSAEIREVFDRLLRGEHVVQFETVRLKKGGTPFPVSQTVFLFKDFEGGTAGIAEISRDITAGKQAEEQLRLAGVAFNHTRDAVLITDAEGLILSVNQAFENITGYSAAEVLGHNPSLMKSGRHEIDFYARFWQELQTEGYWSGEIWNRHRNGHVFPVWQSISAVKDSEGRISHYVGIFTDITEYKDAEARIQYLSYHDDLTGLPNRAFFQMRLDQLIAEAERDQNRIALLVLDLDHFKTVNDSLGHSVGDELLRQVSERLKANVDMADTLARQGGDEFVIALADCEATQAAHVAGDIGSALSRPYAIGSHTLVVTPSLGISLYPHDGRDAETLIKSADSAMYKAKSLGRNTHQFYSAEMSALAAERLTLENALHQALPNREFALHYQPQIDLRSGRVVGLEALIRWRHPGMGWVAPLRFIPVAEDNGVIGQIGWWVLEEACRQQTAWADRGLNLVPVAVNLSPLQLYKSDFPERIKSLLAAAGLEPSFLELELTETAVMRDAGKMEDMLRKLKALGIRLAIDDFGTGYSSLGRLRRFQVDKLKIDQSFVRNVCETEDNATITRAIIALAKQLDLKVLAEGVETEEQLRFLREAGCDEVQGYYFSRPVPADEILPWLSGERTDHP